MFININQESYAIFRHLICFTFELIGSRITCITTQCLHLMLYVLCCVQTQQHILASVRSQVLRSNTACMSSMCLQVLCGELASTNIQARSTLYILGELEWEIIRQDRQNHSNLSTWFCICVVHNMFSRVWCLGTTIHALTILYARVMVLLIISKYYLGRRQTCYCQLKWIT